jgi:hypothetical protein
MIHPRYEPPPRSSYTPARLSASMSEERWREAMRCFARAFSAREEGQLTDALKHERRGEALLARKEP